MICNRLIFSILVFWIALPTEGQFHYQPEFKKRNKAFTQTLESFAKNPALSGAGWGLMIQDVQSGIPLIRFNERQNLIPASNLKLITTLNGLKNLGPNYRFQTRIFIDGPVENGILKGNIWIEGSGDPTIYSPDREKGKSNFFQKVVQLLAEKGIKRIEGQLFEKRHANDYSGIRSDWSWSDVGNYYGAGIFPLNINENYYAIYLQTHGEGKEAKLKKKDSLTNLQIHEISVEASSPGNPDLAYIYWIPGEKKVEIKGSIPQQPEAQRIKGALMDPPTIFFQVLAGECGKAGIEINNQPLAKGIMHELGKIESPELKHIIKEINLNSNNLFTESIGFALCDQGCKSDENGWTQLARFMPQTAAPKGYYFADACGLSLSNRISPEAFVKSLSWAKKQVFFDEFHESLPVSGTSGTMKNFCKSEKAKGKIHAKSGTLNRVLCYAGYVETKSGLKAFSIMLNTYNGGFFVMKKQLENLMEAMVDIQ